MNGNIPFEAFAEPEIDMNQVAGKMDILFLCLDTLRYDVAKEEEEKGNTPFLSGFGPWQKCQAPGNFTYPSHHAMFAGFLPCPWEAKSIMDRKMLFFPKNIGMGRMAPPGAFAFEGATIMEGLERIGYSTWCFGGVAFFDKRSDIGRVFPGYFMHSFWNPSFGCQVKESTANQVDLIIKKIKDEDRKRPVFLYLNVDAVHYPNWFYLEKGGRRDTRESHAAALRYADGQMGRLLDWWRENRGNAFVICCSDHGTCYGEDGCHFHGISHPAVEAVPYKHFFLEQGSRGRDGKRNKERNEERNKKRNEEKNEEKNRKRNEEENEEKNRKKNEEENEEKNRKRSEEENEERNKKRNEEENEERSKESNREKSAAGVCRKR